MNPRFQKLSEALKAKWASGTRRPNTKEAQAKAAKTLREGYASGRLRPVKHSPELLKQIGKAVSAALKGRVTRKTSPAQWERDALALRVKRDPRFAKGEANIRCQAWVLRSPMNVVYRFKNLHVFIEQHSGLFAPDDIVWKKHGTGVRCRALAGIAGMSPRKKFPSGGWKGWTWHSQAERLLNDGKDLLNRKQAA